MRKYFGTDGIRKRSNVSPMTGEIMLRLGMAVGHFFKRGRHRHRVVIGKDTRLSGYMIEPALTSGLISMGMDVFLLGPLPTPGVAMLTKSMRADLGIMISASHNSFEDNGIKLFGPDGMKLSNQVELEIERLMDSDLERNLSTPQELGRAKRLEDANARYTEFLKNTFPKGQTLEGFKIVVDCANGAAYKTAPVVFWELGAEVVSTGIEPNGFNINDKCGSTNPEKISSLVLESKADIGISFDGDADRVIVCDENGQIINGDQLLALIATEWKALKKLEGNGVVGTYMSNLGLERYLNTIDLDLIRVEVGDRYVKERMYKDKINIGGEPSGHIIVSNYSTTGDGIVTALQVLSIIVSKKDKASKVCKIFSNVPQILKNFESSDLKLLNNSDAKKIITDAEGSLGKNNGRLLVRASGTENLIRVMGECENENLLNNTVDKVVEKLKNLAN